MAITAGIVGILLCVAVLMARPEPMAASLVHGIVIASLGLLALAAVATYGTTRMTCVGAFLAAGIYFGVTTVPVLSETVVPILPTETLFRVLSTDVSAVGILDEDSRELVAQVDAATRSSEHWTVDRPGKWAVYVNDGPFGTGRGMLLNPRQIAFHRLGHDFVAIALGLLGAFLGSFYVEPDPNLKRPMPAPEAVAVLRRLKARGH
jgi:hypothetical protein